MTTPKEREEWMPSKEVGLAATLGSYNVPRIDREFHRTGLRAQIAVLEELIAHMRQRYTSEDNPTGSYCNEESCWIADKIHALQAEVNRSTNRKEN